MERNIENIGTLIQAERQNRGITQEELGRRIGVGKAQISKIENGKGLNIKTVNKVLDSMNLSASVHFQDKEKVGRPLVGYVVAVVSEFAKAHRLNLREASNYLNRYHGIRFLSDHYEAEHLLSLEDSVEDLTRICLNNGGGLR